MRVFVGIVAIAVALLAVQAASATTASQKLRKSETVVAWYEGKGAWTLRPRYAKCKQLRFSSAEDRCYRHRLGYRWHKQRVAKLTPKPQLSHLAGWLCILSREGAWNDSGDPYWGGLQMGWWFMRTYGSGLLKAKGPASNWTPHEQMAAAEGGYNMSGYSRAWLAGQWPNTYPPCAHLFG
jgi:hypothetical protein